MRRLHPNCQKRLDSTRRAGGPPFLGVLGLRNRTSGRRKPAVHSEFPLYLRIGGGSLRSRMAIVQATSLS